MAEKQIVVNTDTRLKDLKPGDLVMTAELHRVVEVKSSDYISVTEVRPQCSVCGPKCRHERIMGLGWGQQSVAKVVSMNGKDLS